MSQHMLHGWLLLLLSLPPRPSSLRVRAWRRLRGLGAVPLRSSAYLLPDSPGSLRAVPVARPGDPARRRRGHPAPRGPDREHAAAGRGAPLPGGPQPGLRGPRGALPQAAQGPPAAARRGAGPARARDGPDHRDRLLRGARPPRGRARAGSGRRSARPRGGRGRRARPPPLDLAALKGPPLGHAPAAPRGPHRLGVAHQALRGSGGRVRLRAARPDSG